jgi:hypothetical protein
MNMKMVLLVGSASRSALAARLTALSGEMAGLAAVVACLGSTIISARRAIAATIVISAGRSSISAGIIFATLLAELDGDALAIKVLVVKFLNCSLGILLVLVLAEGVGTLLVLVSFRTIP